MTVSPTSSGMGALSAPLASGSPFTVTATPAAADGVSVTLVTSFGTSAVYAVLPDSNDSVPAESASPLSTAPSAPGATSSLSMVTVAAAPRA